jgi:hypothetical protein
MKPIRAERRVWQRLKDASTAEEIREACRVSRYWLRPNRGGRVFVQLLADRAEMFLRAKRDPRCPGSSRPSSEDKLLDYFAGAMAGITLRGSPITAIDQLRKWKHPKKCDCWRCLAKLRPQ